MAATLPPISGESKIEQSSPTRRITRNIHSGPGEKQGKFTVGQ